MIDTILIFAGVFLAINLAVIIWAILSYNNLRTLDARCQQAKNDIDVQLKHRSDLLPNLVESVRSFLGQENKLLAMMHDVQLAAAATAHIENKTKANANISNSIQNMFASLEGIPELQSSSHYIGLRAQILDTENKITASRRFLNLAVSEFNAKRSQFPGGLIADLAKIGERDGFNLGAERIFHEEAPILKI